MFFLTYILILKVLFLLASIFFIAILLFKNITQEISVALISDFWISPGVSCHCQHWGIHEILLIGYLPSQSSLSIWDFFLGLMGFSTGKRIWGMVLFKMIEECATPKVLWIIHIYIQAPHTEHSIRRPRYCNMIGNKNTRRRFLNTCFTALNWHCIRQPWNFEKVEGIKIKCNSHMESGVCNKR